MGVEGANSHFRRHVAVNSVPGIPLDDASRAGEPSLNNTHAGAVVFDSRRSPREARKRCRIDRHHSHPTTELNNHADWVSPDHYASRSYVAESEDSVSCSILKHSTDNQCRG